MLLLIRKKAKRYPIGKVSSTQLVPYVHNKWHTDTVHEMVLVVAQDTGLKRCPTFSCARVHVGDIPATCVARVVGNHQAILMERQSEVAPHAPAIQADVRASGDRLLDQDQQQKVLDLMESCFNFMLQSPKQT